MPTELELKCLWAIADDYEEIPMIVQMLKSMMETDATGRDTSMSLHNLVISKLAQAYEYNELKSDFAEVKFTYEKALSPCAVDTWRPGVNTEGRTYFYITPLGKEFLKGKSSPCSEK